MVIAMYKFKVKREISCQYKIMKVWEFMNKATDSIPINGRKKHRWM